MSTYRMLLAMHCPSGSAWVWTEGAARFTGIETHTGALPACTIDECSESKIMVSNTKADQGPDSDHLAFWVNVELDVGGSIEIGCDGPPKSSAWFQLEGIPGRFACPPQFANEAGKLSVVRENGALRVVRVKKKAKGLTKR